MSDTAAQPTLDTRPDDRKKTIVSRTANAVAVCYWLTMFAGTHIPQPELIIGPDVSDKFLHFSAYFCLYVVLAVRTRLIRSQWPDVRHTLVLTALTTSYSAFDELTQGLPGINRFPDLQDAIADCCGVAAAILVMAIVAWSERRLRADASHGDSTDPS